MAERSRVLPPTYFLGALVAMLLLHVLVPAAELIPSPWRYLGAIPLALGMWLNLASSDLFRRHETTIRPFEESRALVTRGPFAFTRNPMYVGGGFILLGLAGIFGSVTPFLVPPLYVWLMDRRFIVPEEQALQEQFGETYESYRQRVRRWL